MSSLDAMLCKADDALLRCLELAHESFLAGALPVSSLIASSNGKRVSEGRNVPIIMSAGLNGCSARHCAL